MYNAVARSGWQGGFSVLSAMGMAFAPTSFGMLQGIRTQDWPRRATRGLKDTTP